MTLFPFAEYWWFYGGFTLFVLAMLAVDLGRFGFQADDVILGQLEFGAVLDRDDPLVLGYEIREHVE